MKFRISLHPTTALNLGIEPFTHQIVEIPVQRLTAEQGALCAQITAAPAPWPSIAPDQRADVYLDYSQAPGLKGTVCDLAPIPAPTAENVIASLDRVLALRVERKDRDAAEAAEQRAWIGEHGSPRLRKLAGEGIEFGAVYRDERLAVDRPGWRWAKSVPGEGKEPRNAPDEALMLLDAARGTLPLAKRPEAHLAHWTWASRTWRGYVVVAQHMGAEIVFGAPENLA